MSIGEVLRSMHPWHPVEVAWMETIVKRDGSKDIESRSIRSTAGVLLDCLEKEKLLLPVEQIETYLRDMHTPGIKITTNR